VLPGLATRLPIFTRPLCAWSFVLTGTVVVEWEQAIVSEKHYRLVPPDQISPQDLETCRHRVME
jgi:hypothetical protein